MTQSTCVSSRLPKGYWMNQKLMSCLVALGSVALIGCAESPGDAAPQVKSVVATTTEQTLLGSLNEVRQKSGKAPLTVSSTLSGLARGESDAAAAAGRIPGDTTASLSRRSGFPTVGKLQGALKDRGPQSGKGFVEYWAEGNSVTVMGDWSKVGVGVSKSSDGRLFAVVVLGSLGSGSGGSSLMQPAFRRSGLQRR